MLKHFLFLICCNGLFSASAQTIRWHKFNQQAFDLAGREHKPVLLDLGASWCHWCHVMDDSTYENPEVINYLSKNYICIKANQDKRPDLYAKYKDYGWPATVIFHEDGRELLKEAGYFPPAEFLLLIQKTYNDYSYTKPSIKTPENKVSTGKWSAATAAFVRDNYFEHLDMENGGYDMQQHFLEYDGIEYALDHFKTNAQLRRWLPLTIHGSYQINDPVWGGVYQYSTHGDWQHPHFEKILSIQARYIKIYTTYFAATKDSSALCQAKKIIGYLDAFLYNGDNLYYNSQDADLKAGEHAGGYFVLSSPERYSKGIPQIDSTCYAKENAQLADAFITLYTATGEETYLTKAGKILQTIQRDYHAPDGGYLHDRAFSGSMALADQLYTCQAWLHYYQATRKQAHLDKARELADYIIHHFTGQNKALFSFSNNNKYLPPDALLNENIDAGKILLQLSRYGYPQYKTAAENIFGYISSPAVLKNIIAEPGILTLEKMLRQ